MHQEDPAAYVPVGLENLGNSCFVNSVLQSLTCSSSLFNAIKYSEHQTTCPSKKGSHDVVGSDDHSQQQGCVLCAIEEHIENARKHGITTTVTVSATQSSASVSQKSFNWSRLIPSVKNNVNAMAAVSKESNTNNTTVIAPKKIIDLFPKISPLLTIGLQEDAHEFLRALVIAMQESLPPQNQSQSQNRRSIANGNNENIDVNLPSAVNSHDTNILLGKTPRLDSNYPKTLFSGGVRNYVQCMSCKCISVKEDHIEDLQLDISRAGTLENALKNFCNEEVLNGDNAYYCSRCCTRTEAVRSMRLQHLPDLLVIQLKRFKYTFRAADGTTHSTNSSPSIARLFGGPRSATASPGSRNSNQIVLPVPAVAIAPPQMTIEKLSHFVEYPSILDLSDFMTDTYAVDTHRGVVVPTAGTAATPAVPPVAVQQAEQSPTKRARRDDGKKGYHRLIAVVNHLGGSVMNGHYIAHVNADHGKWFCVDDDVVTNTTEQQALSQKDAYILFYQRDPELTHEGYEQHRARGFVPMTPAAKVLPRVQVTALNMQAQTQTPARGVMSPLMSPLGNITTTTAATPLFSRLSLTSPTPSARTVIPLSTVTAAATTATTIGAAASAVGDALSSPYTKPAATTISTPLVSYTQVAASTPLVSYNQVYEAATPDIKGSMNEVRKLPTDRKYVTKILHTLGIRPRRSPVKSHHHSSKVIKSDRDRKSHLISVGGGSGSGRMFSSSSSAATGNRSFFSPSVIDKNNIAPPSGGVVRKTVSIRTTTMGVGEGGGAVIRPPPPSSSSLPSANHASSSSSSVFATHQPPRNEGGSDGTSTNTAAAGGGAVPAVADGGNNRRKEEVSVDESSATVVDDADNDHAPPRPPPPTTGDDDQNYGIRDDAQHDDIDRMRITGGGQLGSATINQSRRRSSAGSVLTAISGMLAGIIGDNGGDNDGDYEVQQERGEGQMEVDDEEVVSVPTQGYAAAHRAEDHTTSNTPTTTVGEAAANIKHQINYSEQTAAKFSSSVSSAAAAGGSSSSSSSSWSDYRQQYYSMPPPAVSRGPFSISGPAAAASSAPPRPPQQSLSVQPSTMKRREIRINAGVGAAGGGAGTSAAAAERSKDLLTTAGANEQTAASGESNENRDKKKLTKKKSFLSLGGKFFVKALKSLLFEDSPKKNNSSSKKDSYSSNGGTKRKANDNFFE